VSCYHMSSLNESKAKQVCKKYPTQMINQREKQLMRIYPAGFRIDSSNFNPIIFWAFGIQFVALNYQISDVPMHINAAMYEQTGNSGYVLKPSVMWDRKHVMFNRFNPWEKEYDGLHATTLTVHLISGQYVCQGNQGGSPMVEIELLGIHADCAKQKSKVISRNALNPIWNEVFTFQVIFKDLVFVRFTVVESGSGRITSQRVIPLKALRPGYRHVRLRTMANQPLELSTLFIYSRHEEEVIGGTVSENPHDEQMKKKKSMFNMIKSMGEIGKSEIKEKEQVGGTTTNIQTVKPKRRMFFISVFGVTSSDEYMILRVTQDTSTQQAIKQALAKAGKTGDCNTEDFLLMEDVQRSWNKKEQQRTGSQRILNPDEKVLLAQNKWRGSGKFYLKKKTNDPSSRAWMTTLVTKELGTESSNDGESQTWDTDHQMFLVCVYNVSEMQPYTIFRAPISSTAQDIITQAILKGRSETEDSRNLILVEELTTEASVDSPSKRRSSRVEKRILADNENVYAVQKEWKGISGRFILMDREEVLQEMEKREKRNSKETGRLVGITKQLTKLKMAKSFSGRPKSQSDYTTEQVQRSESAPESHSHIASATSIDTCSSDTDYSEGHYVSADPISTHSPSGPRAKPKGSTLPRQIKKLSDVLKFTKSSHTGSSHS
ncbi:unnamed protein product, partial [Owenia fusiformis]